MIVCPYCDHENVDGVHVCRACGEPLGAYSTSEAATPVGRSLVEGQIREMPALEALVVSPDTSVGEVLAHMADRGVGCAVVVERGELVGIFTERDALQQLNDEAAELADRPVRDFMTDSVETLEPTDRIAVALRKMDLGGYRHIPILDAGHVTGVVSVRGILDYITAAM